MKELFIKIIGIIGTAITAWFSIPSTKITSFKIFLFIIVVIAVFILLWDLYEYLINKEKTFKKNNDEDKNKIAKYLIKELNASGAITIFSRDLTWVKSGSDAEKSLIKKSKNNEVKIFIESANDSAQKLKQAGADIRTYKSSSGSGFNPKSRFTILDSRTSGSSVMIGVPKHNKHVIKKYTQSDFELIDLINDYVTFLDINSEKL